MKVYRTNKELMSAMDISEYQVRHGRNGKLESTVFISYPVHIGGNHVGYIYATLPAAADQQEFSSFWWPADSRRRPGRNQQPDDQDSLVSHESRDALVRLAYALSSDVAEPFRFPSHLDLIGPIELGELMWQVEYSQLRHLGRRERRALQKRPGKVNWQPWIETLLNNDLTSLLSVEEDEKARHGAASAGALRAIAVVGASRLCSDRSRVPALPTSNRQTPIAISEGVRWSLDPNNRWESAFIKPLDGRPKDEEREPTGETEGRVQERTSSGRDLGGALV